MLELKKNSILIWAKIEKHLAADHYTFLEIHNPAVKFIISAVEVKIITVYLCFLRGNI